jgi:uncharacterized OB-fold protein
MSWSPDLYIGEFRPWPDSVHVVRGRTDEQRRYFPRETAKRVTVTVDERGTIGHTECSECGVLVGMDDRYCRHCGKEFT